MVQQGCTLATATGKPAYMKEDLDLLSSFTLTGAEMTTLSAVRGLPPLA